MQAPQAMGAQGRRSLPGDVLAGLAVAGMLLPEAVAYAAIAGVPTVHALVAALVGLSVYPLLGSSRFATVSATSSAAAIFASMVAANGVASGYALVGLTGGLFLIAALLKANFLAAFISRPVLRGFAWALAFTIVVKQIPHVAGIHVHTGKFFPLVWELLQRAGEARMPSLLFGVGALVLWLLLLRLRSRAPWIQPSLLVLVLGVLAGVLWPLRSLGVAQVGVIDLHGLQPQWPDLDWAMWVHTAQVAPALLMILFAESWGATRSLALQHGDDVNPRREMLALGAANIASSLLQGLPVGAGFSASSANQEAGGRSKWAGVFAAVSIALMLWWLRDWLALLPIPVLAAVVIGILLHKLGPKPVIAPLRMGGDAWLAVAAAAGVLLFGVLFGMLLAVGFSVLLALRRFAEPAWSELGRLPGSHDFLDLARHPEARRVPGVLVVRPEEPVFFANAEAIFQQVRTLAQTGEIRMVVLSMEASDDLDTTSVEALSELQDYLDARGQTLLLARVKDGPRAALQRAGSVLVDGPAAPPHAANSGAQAIIWEMYWSVDDAVTAGYNRLLQERSSSPVPQDHEAV